MNDEYNLQSEFDAEKHKEKYVNYLEVVIDENGTVMYAVPSHQEKVIEIACKKMKVNRQQLEAMCPPEYYLDFGVWLCKVANAVMIWNDFYMCATMNRKQMAAIRKLKLCGLYKGDVPDNTKIKGEKQKND